MISKHDLLLYAITDRAWLHGETLIKQVERALKGGVTCLQLREKHLCADALLAEAREIGTLCRLYHVPFLLDDCVELALACGADGVHVGPNDMPAAQARRLLGPDKILGVSARSIEQALRAEQDGADYLGAGAVFPTATKQDARPMTRETLQAICNAVHIPVIAIGGITQQNLPRLAGCGACGAAVISAIFAQPDITVAARTLRKLSERTFQPEGGHT